jgi:hypothetical protein
MIMAYISFSTAFHHGAWWKSMVSPLSSIADKACFLLTTEEKYISARF